VIGGQVAAGDGQRVTLLQDRVFLVVRLDLGFELGEGAGGEEQEAVVADGNPPVWRQALDPPAVQALIEYFFLSRSTQHQPSTALTGIPSESSAYMVQTGRKLPDSSKFDGVLAPIPVTTIH
jgi:hypothetical protein